MRLLSLLTNALILSPPVLSTVITLLDKLAIVEQINLHQNYIDNSGSLANATLWLSLYWPEVSFTAIDKFGSTTRTGASPTNETGIKYFYDYDHSVFPLEKWFHSVDVWRFTTDRAGLTDNQTKVHWRWRVSWKTDTQGVVSTGTYDDVFEKRDGVWKCLSRVSTTDENWPQWIFEPYSKWANESFSVSK